MVHEDFDGCYRAVSSRDTRFDGRFVTAVRTTGIYCRPSCPAQTPRRENVRFFPRAAAASAAGFRACKRCRPDAAPGSRDWDVRADLAARALRGIESGVVDTDGVPGLARRLASANDTCIARWSARSESARSHSRALAAHRRRAC